VTEEEDRIKAAKESFQNWAEMRDLDKFGGYDTVLDWTVERDRAWNIWLAAHESGAEFARSEREVADTSVPIIQRLNAENAELRKDSIQLNEQLKSEREAGRREGLLECAIAICEWCRLNRPFAEPIYGRSYEMWYIPFPEHPEDSQRVRCQAESIQQVLRALADKGHNILAESTQGGTGVTSERLVTLMELLRVYANRYADFAYQLELSSNLLDTSDIWAPQNKATCDFIRTRLEALAVMCIEGDLPVTAIPIGAGLIAFKEHKATNPVLKHLLTTIRERLVDELSTKLFFQLPHSRKELFENPLNKWSEVIERFAGCSLDVGEASKCFALSRYAACVFHCVQIIEHGLLELGTFLSVNDPISGWTAVANELKKIINKKHDQRSDFEKKHFQFIEQMQGTVEALKNAWRNKISHVSGQRLLLVSSEFTPDTAEEIMTATRAFMRRLTESLPNEK
jgi:hypothetical protein